MLKQFAKKILGDGTVYYLKDKWNVRKNVGIRRKRAAFYAQFVNEGDLCFDVGANYGNRIEALLDVGARVVAVEPQQECCKFLKRKYGSEIEIVSKGLGAQMGELEFYTADASTLATFSKDWIDTMRQSGRFHQHSWDNKTIVEITTLDNLIQLYGIPQFIKIDVEGYELEVLKGLSAAVGYISFEYAVPEQVEKMVACLRHIQSLAPGQQIKCNYSIGESMTWASPTWLSCDDMIELIHAPTFIETSFGDIYVHTLPNHQMTVE